MSKEPLHLTDATFEKEVLESDLPVLVDFWAPWCGPCRMVAPMIKELAAEFDGRMVVAKINTDENSETAIKYGIMSIPSMIIFKDGQEAERMIGARPKQALAEALETFLSSPE
ncbi:MAG TPA: thioredoxin [Anaerolineae bacterium]|nr:thioredoxin [Anaerolineae bacterium]